MTNTEIIISEAINNGIYSQEQISSFPEAGQTPPIHTWAEWMELGYKVKPGEHAVIKTKLWRYVSTPNKEDSKEDEESHFIMVTANLFSHTQVEPYLKLKKCVN